MAGCWFMVRSARSCNSKMGLQLQILAHLNGMCLFTKDVSTICGPHHTIVLKTICKTESRWQQSDTHADGETVIMNDNVIMNTTAVLCFPWKVKAIDCFFHISIIAFL